MTKAIDQSEKEAFALVTFCHGDPANLSFARYTDWAQLVAGPGTGFQSVPEMAIRLPDNGATLTKKEATVDVPSDAFTDRAGLGVPHSPIYVKIQEQTRATTAGQAGTLLTLMVGRVIRTKRNVHAKEGVVRFKILPIRSRLGRAKLGIPANANCVFSLFGDGCQLLRSVHLKTIAVDSISGFEITVTSPAFTAPTSPGGDVARFWERGYIERDGLRVGIKRWVLTDPTKAVLREEPPQEWLTGNVSAIPGCHLTPADCEDVWDNIINGGFYGIRIPDYQPLFEDPF